MITPQDIGTKVFKKRFHGYDVKEVDRFMQEISEDYEKLYKENLSANERIRMLSDVVKQYKSMEDSLSASAMGSEAIVEEAKAQAEQMIAYSAKEVQRITYQYEQMKRSVEVFRAKVVSLLHAQLDIIKDYSDVLVDDKTFEDAKEVYENVLSHTEERTERINPAEQKTTEIPVISE